MHVSFNIEVLTELDIKLLNEIEIIFFNYMIIMAIRVIYVVKQKYINKKK